MSFENNIDKPASDVEQGARIQDMLDVTPEKQLEKRLRSLMGKRVSEVSLDENRWELTIRLENDVRIVIDAKDAESGHLIEDKINLHEQNKESSSLSVGETEKAMQSLVGKKNRICFNTKG